MMMLMVMMTTLMMMGLCVGEGLSKKSDAPTEVMMMMVLLMMTMWLKSLMVRVCACQPKTGQNCGTHCAWHRQRSGAAPDRCRALGKELGAMGRR